MLCPICKTELKMTDRQGVEVDYCPNCRGVWLDRGELDKIIERSTTGHGQFESEARASRPEPDKRAYASEHDDDPRQEYGKKKKKRGFLEDIFDF